MFLLNLNVYFFYKKNNMKKKVKNIKIFSKIELEKNVLAYRIEKLLNALSLEKKDREWSDEQNELMIKQLEVMMQYFEILDTRLYEISKHINNEKQTI